MLNIFLGRKPLPNYRLVEPSSGKLETITVKEDVGTGHTVAECLRLICATDHEN